MKIYFIILATIAIALCSRNEEDVVKYQDLPGLPRCVTARGEFTTIN